MTDDAEKPYRKRNRKRVYRTFPPDHDFGPEVHDRCNAHTRAGKRCKAWAGQGTEHLGTGRCKLHGGNSPGGPPGHQNNLSHNFSPRHLLPFYRASQKKLFTALEKAWNDATDYDLVVGLIKGEMEYCIKAITDLEGRRADSEAIGEFHHKAREAYDYNIVRWFDRLATLQKNYPDMLVKAKELGLMTDDDEPDQPMLIDVDGYTITVHPGATPADVAVSLPPAGQTDKADDEGPGGGASDA